MAILISVWFVEASDVTSWSPRSWTLKSSGQFLVTSWMRNLAKALPDRYGTHASLPSESRTNNPIRKSVSAGGRCRGLQPKVFAFLLCFLQRKLVTELSTVLPRLETRTKESNIIASELVN